MSSICCLSLWLPKKPHGSENRRKQAQYIPPRNYHPSSSPGRPRSSSKRKMIYFYDKDKPHYSFTNFAEYSVRYEGRLYPTSEHLFQAMKFLDTRPDIAEKIRTTRQASDALNLARSYQAHVSPTWYDNNIAVMNKTLELKFTQHERLRRELLETGDAELVEDSPEDAFWGNGPSKKGRNELGKALVRLRTKLREGEAPVMRQTDSR